MMQRVKISRSLIEQMLTTGYTLTHRLEVLQGIEPGAQLAFVDLHEASDSITFVFDVPDSGSHPDKDVEVLIRETLFDPEPSPLPGGVL